MHVTASHLVEDVRFSFKKSTRIEKKAYKVVVSIKDGFGFRL